MLFEENATSILHRRYFVIFRKIQSMNVRILDTHELTTYGKFEVNWFDNVSRIHCSRFYAQML